MKYRKGGGNAAAAGESNDDDGSTKGGRDAPPSIQVDIVEYHGGGGGGGGGGGLGNGGGGSASFFEPWREATPGSGSGHGSSGRSGGREPPEKRLTLFALRLAVLEKAASGLGKLDFMWATVVLLGGFASTLNITDFWCVNVILVGEGARVFSRSHELEWQHHSTLTFTAGGALRSSSRLFRRLVHALADPAAAAVTDGARGQDARDMAAQFQRQIVAFMKQRAWHAPDVSLLPYTGWVFVSKKIGRLLSRLQVLSALACVALSVMRLWRHNFGHETNKRPALLLFYTLALLEALLFLLERAYWTWKISVQKLLEQVSGDCELGEYGHVSLTRFFYDAYSRCITGSIFDGIKMDLVTFAEELILSEFQDEQLIGVRILQQFADAKGFTRDTVRKVGTSARSIERLMEMLNWKRPEEEEVRWCAAEVVSKLARKRQNALRVSGIPGAIESVMSLLYAGWSAPASAAPHDASPAARSYDHPQFNLLGLLILKRLARDHDNCGKIGNTRGLLAKIIEFTHASPALLRNTLAPESQVCVVKLALKVVKILVSTTGGTGKKLRREVAENVFTVSSLRGVLQHGQQHRALHKLATDILSGLAMDDKGKQVIVGTGGVVKQLLSIFVDAEMELGGEAGEALAMLALESEASCAAILKRDDVRARPPRVGAGGRRRGASPERGEGSAQPVRIRWREASTAPLRGDQRNASGSGTEGHHDRERQDPRGVRRLDDANLQVHRRRSVRRRATRRRHRREKLRGAAGEHPAGPQVPGDQGATDAAVRRAAGHLAHDLVLPRRRRRRRRLRIASPGGRDGAAAGVHRRHHVRAGVLPRVLRQRRNQQAPGELLRRRRLRARAARRRRSSS